VTTYASIVPHTSCLGENGSHHRDPTNAIDVGFGIRGSDLVVRSFSASTLVPSHRWNIVALNDGRLGDVGVS